MKKNLFLTFCFSFIPGAGQMYQGYMKKGMSLLALLAVSIAVASFTNINIFIVPIPLIFAYSFFDTYNIRSKAKQDIKEDDKVIWENEELQKVFGKFRISKKNGFIGVGLILLGLYIFMNSVLISIATRYDIAVLEEVLQIVSRYLAPVLIAASSIVLGVKFISKGKE